nr:MAG TPA: hypothetical protein [Caudoviricetes sp.]
MGVNPLPLSKFYHAHRVKSIIECLARIICCCLYPSSY